VFTVDFGQKGLEIWVKVQRKATRCARGGSGKRFGVRPKNRSHWAWGLFSELSRRNLERKMDRSYTSLHL